MPNPPVQASAEKTLCRELESDADRLAVSLEETLKTHVEHCSSLKAALERLSGAIETFKPPPQSDKETTFWTAYKTLSDEFDKEFQRKYANDLDTSLIFAGLFSAVTSAFILQIQPELLPDQTQALTILVENMASTTPLQIESGPRTIIVVAQSLLYFSLFSTLFAALLAVLGKQWLLHYDSVGERGTLEERGLERQRKFDGLRRWKFEPIMQIFPLLLQFPLLLFATALSIYLWTIHHAIAAIVFGFTSLGCVLYTLMVVAALASPDSPFQTSLTTLLRALLKVDPIPRSLRRFARRTRRRAHRGIATFFLPLSLVYTGFTETIQPLLPRFRTKEEDFELKSPGGRIFDNIQEPSQQISAVQWALETSTDPRMVEAAAAMVSDLQWQWPVDIDLRPSLKRLWDIYRGCFEGDCVREGMGNRASSCVKAFGLLRIIADEQVNKEFRWLDLANDRSHPLNGSSVIAFARIQCESASETLSWNLRFISAQQYHAFHAGPISYSVSTVSSSVRTCMISY
ncbi:hypothetical protein B0H14DRAFT_212164 [Mycena olivaceomarginata]|nr:hypothetical protein B0H14DRAFT_212164 [Mycena olivaceomarginata]